VLDVSACTSISLFEGIAKNDLERIAQRLRFVQFSRGAYLFLAGEVPQSIYLLMDGIVKKSYVNARGEERILRLVQRNEMFGDLFLGKYRHRIANAVAITDVSVAMLLEDDLLELIARMPKLAHNMLKQLADTQRETLARMHALSQNDARFRLLGILLTLARREPANDEGWYQLPAGIFQDDIANIAGLNRSTASLLINELRREGVLGGVGRQLTIHRMQIEAILLEAGLEILE
jgi:CRP/FNR family transcriptional regulator, cyclic AMP receptor protein